jgi:uncharacterized protein YjbJ (UPF0337 family)
MAGEQDKVEGTIKEKVGSATGNDRLEGEGKTQHASGKVEDAVKGVRDTLAGMKDAAKDKIGGSSSSDRDRA